MKEYIHRFDRVVNAFTVRIPASFRPLMLFATLLGQPPITVGVSAAIIGYGVARQDLWLIVAGIIAIATFVISSIMKVFLRRARPINDYVKNMFIQTFSFPSGHAAGSVVSFGLLSIVVMAHQPIGMLFAVATVVVCFVIGLSRVFLGAHYASDVVGGWLVGMVGLLAILLVGDAL